MKKIIAVVVFSIFPLAVLSQSITQVETTPDAIVCKEPRDATKLEQAIKGHNLESLMTLMRSGKCWEVGARTYNAFDYNPRSHIQMIQLSREGFGSLLTIFIK